MNRKLILMTTLAVSTSASVHAATTLYVGGYGGVTENIFKQKLIPAFEEKTGTNVVYVAGNSTSTLAKIKAQAGNQELSVALIDDGPMYQAVGQNLCADLDSYPGFDELYPGAHMTGGKSVGIGYIAVGLAYNKEAFNEKGWAAPTSWHDLEDSKYEQRVVIPPISNGYGLLTLLMMAKLNDGGENNIEPGFDVMSDEVGPNVLAWEPSPGKMAQMLQTGEAALAVWGNGRVQTVIDQGAPVEFVYPKEGGVALLSAACAVEGAPEPELAQQFIQHITSAESQKILAEENGWGPVNQKTQLTPEVAQRVVYGPEKVNALISPDYDVINANRSAWTTRWTRSVE